LGLAGTAFVSPLRGARQDRRTPSAPATRMPSVLGALEAPSRVGRVGVPVRQAAVATAVALLAAAAGRRRSHSAKPSARAVLVAAPELTGRDSAAVPEEPRSLVARRSAMSCYKMYFNNPPGWPYGDRNRRNLRNRAYNLFMKNKYKKKLRNVIRYTVGLEFGDKQPSSKDEVMAEIKDKLDDACLTIDEVCVQGVLHRVDAAWAKDRMCRAILRGCIKKGLLEKPEDPFEPAYQSIGYDMPVYTRTREPRPWQLPGWKSPWMLKREYDQWLKLREEKQKA